MLLAMDVGNSNIKVGLFEGEKLISSFRITTNADRSSDEYGLLIIHFLSYLNRTGLAARSSPQSGLPLQAAERGMPLSGPSVHGVHLSIRRTISI